MDPDDHSTAYGVFKPVGHVVVAFPTAADCDAANAAYLDMGVTAQDLTRYTPEQMVEQVAQNVASAGPLASLGQELNLIKAHGELARQGSSFLVIRANEQALIDQVAEVAKRFHASRAQHYGMLLIEELLPVGSSDRQVAESSDRGLDAQTVSSKERPAGTG